ncbi:metal-sensitive transcriptional regulator [Nocardioides sp.]|uniref:metal-sensitive transcriptional regulator n=1 Tax=Nocardioides sp. TaxID=35761 RepID=UPI003512A4D6
MTDLDPAEMKAIITRMKRAHGHLGSVIRMLEEGTDCESVLTQLAAVNKAVARSGFAIVATGMQQCLAEVEEGQDGVDPAKIAKMEKLFLSLA